MENVANIRQIFGETYIYEITISINIGDENVLLISWCSMPEICEFDLLQVTLKYVVHSGMWLKEKYHNIAYS